MPWREHLSVCVSAAVLQRRTQKFSTESAGEFCRWTDTWFSVSLPFDTHRVHHFQRLTLHLRDVTSHISASASLLRSNPNSELSFLWMFYFKLFYYLRSKLN